jgi:hypothetical protein
MGRRAALSILTVAIEPDAGESAKRARRRSAAAAIAGDVPATVQHFKM